MSRTMYDAVDWPSIPRSASMVAGYYNGAYRWPDAAWNRFQDAIKVRIDVNGLAAVECDVLDIESGDVSPVDAPGWIRSRIPHGRACLYFDRSSMSAVAEAVAGFKGVDVWVADWTGTAHTVEVASNMHLVGVQYASFPGTYDKSVIYDPVWPLGEV